MPWPDGFLNLVGARYTIVRWLEASHGEADQSLPGGIGKGDAVISDWRKDYSNCVSGPRCLKLLVKEVCAHWQLEPRRPSAGGARLYSCTLRCFAPRSSDVYSSIFI